MPGRTVGALVALAGASARRWLPIVVVAKFLTLVAVVGGALKLTSAAPTTAVVFVVAYAALFAVQSVARAAALRDARRALTATTTDALLHADVLDAAEGAQNEHVVHEGLYNAERVVVQLLPDLVAYVAGGIAAGLVVVVSVPPRVVLLGAAAVFVGALGVLLARRMTVRAQRLLEADFLPFGNALSDVLHGRLDLVANGREQEQRRRVVTAANLWTASALRADRVASLAGRAPVLGAAIGAGLVVAMDQAAAGALTLDALARAALLGSALPPFAGAAYAAIDLARTRARLAPFLAVLSAPPRIAGAGQAVPPLPTTIAFSHVAFAYAGSSRRALDGVSFTATERSLVALTGANGSGKSTCLRLLLGLAPPTAGRIGIGSSDLLSLDLVAWRRRTAYLPQRPYLPERATVRDAVKLLAVDADDAAIEAALARVEILDALRIASPAAPLEVVVATLSTGQRQRVAIARALAQNADVLLFDEPDANLDVAGVARVVRILKDAAKDKLVVVAAHTEELVAAADRVVRLVNGRVSE